MSRISLDQLDDFSPTFLEDVQDGQYPRWNGSNGDFEPATLPSGVVFGSEYVFDKELGNTVTSSTSWKNHHTFTTPSLPAGKYMIQWLITWNTKKKDTHIEFRIRANGDALEDEFTEVSPPDNYSYFRNKLTAFAEYTLAADGTITFTIDIRRQGTNKKVYAYDSSVMIYRVG